VLKQLASFCRGPAERRSVLTENESKALLSADHIPVVETRIAPEISALAALH
jgi:hypothetical protein